MVATPLQTNQKLPVQMQEQSFYVIGKLWFLDSSYKEIMITLPFLGCCSDIYEMAAMFLKGYIQNLTRHYIGITHFQIIDRSRNEETGEWYEIAYVKTEIPTGKVFVGKMNFGDWVDPSGLTRPEAREILSSRYSA